MNRNAYMSGWAKPLRDIHTSLDGVCYSAKGPATWHTFKIVGSCMIEGQWWVQLYNHGWCLASKTVCYKTRRVRLGLHLEGWRSLVNE